MKINHLILWAGVVIGTTNCTSQNDDLNPRQHSNDCSTSITLGALRPDGIREYQYPSESLRVCGLIEGNIRIDRTGTEECPEDLPGSCTDEHCPSACIRNTDCEQGLTCACAAARPVNEEPDPDGSISITHTNACVPAECVSSDDCNGAPCGFAVDNCNLPFGYFCRTSQDECKGQSDCEQWDYCGYDVERKIWTCQNRASCD